MEPAFFSFQDLRNHVILSDERSEKSLKRPSCNRTCEGFFIIPFGYFVIPFEYFAPLRSDLS